MTNQLRWYVTDYQRIYSLFDISSIPAGATINGAIYCIYRTSATPIACASSVYHVTSDSNWTELGVTWNNQPCGGTAFDHAANCNLTAESTRAGIDANAYNCYNITQMVTRDYEASDTNLSIVLKTAENDCDTLGRVFGAREGADGVQPYVNITFTEGASPPASGASNITWVSPTDANGTEPYDQTYVQFNVTVDNFVSSCVFEKNGTSNYSATYVLNDSVSVCTYDDTGYTQNLTSCMRVYVTDQSGHINVTPTTICRNLNISAVAAAPPATPPGFCFIERDTMPWVRGASTTDSTAKMVITLNGTQIKSYPYIGTDFHYGYQCVNFSVCDVSGSTLNISFIGYRTAYLLYDIRATDCAGKQYTFSPWALSSQTANSQIFWDNRRDDRLVVTLAATGYLNLTATLTKAPELEILPSGLSFVNDSITTVVAGDSPNITVQVWNRGAGAEANATVKLYRNGVLFQTISDHAIAAGSYSNFSFVVPIPTVPANITVYVIPSGAEGLESNNYATKYVLNRPYFYATDYTTTYCYQNPTDAFCADNMGDLNSTCATANVVNYQTYPYESVKANYAHALAVCGLMNGKTNYMNKSMEALYYAVTNNWNWANRSNAGNTTEGTTGSATVYPVNTTCSNCEPEDSGSAWGKYLIEYSLTYDAIHDYIAAYDATNGTTYLPQIRDKLAHMCQDGYLLAKEIYTYPAGADFDTAYVWGDWGTGKLAMIPGVGVCSLALLDYDGQYQDVERFDEAVSFVRDDLFTENFKATGAPEGILAIQTTEGGLWEEGSGYRDYHEPVLSYLIAAYKSAYGINLADIYDLAYGYMTSTLFGTVSHGRYSQNLGHTNYAGAWWPNLNYAFAFDQSRQEYGLFSYYINETLGYDYGYRGQSAKNQGAGDFGAYEGLLIYNASASKTSTITSYFDPYGTYATLRYGFSPSYQVVNIVAPRNHTMSGHSAGYISQLSYEYWAKGAFASGFSGDARYLTTMPGAPGRLSNNGIGIQCMACSYNGGARWKSISRDTKGTYGSMANPSRLTDFMNTSHVLFVKGNANISRSHNMTSSDAYEANFPSNHTWDRAMLMIGNDYLVVFDKLHSVNGSIQNYAVVDNLMSASAWSNSGTDEGNFAWDNLTLNGIISVEWYDRSGLAPNRTFWQNVYNATWHTRAEVNALETSFRPINATISYNPMIPEMEVTIGKAHVGSYGLAYEYYKPTLISNQSGADVKFIRVNYPAATGDTNAIMTNINTMTGNTSNDYATQIDIGTRRDIITYSDGEDITAGYVGTDCVISISKNDSVTGLSYTFCYNGTYMNDTGVERVSTNATTNWIHNISSTDSNSTTVFQGEAGTSLNATVHVDNPAGANVTVNGVSKTKGTDWDVAGTSSVWVRFSFASDVTVYVMEGGGEAAATLSACILENGTQNITMTVVGNYCYYNMTGQSDNTQLNFRVWVNNSDGDSNYTEWRRATINLTEGVKPEIKIWFPANASIDNDYAEVVNFTVSDNDVVDSCWWNDDGTTNTTIPGCSGNITGPWTDGLMTVTVWANDTSGNCNYSIVYFTVDGTAPMISSVTASPANLSQYNTTNRINLQATFTDALGVVDAVFIEWEGANHTATNTTDTWNYTAGSLAAGYYTYRWYANDTLGNLNATQTYGYNVTLNYTNDVVLHINSSSAGLQMASDETSNATGFMVFSSGGAAALFRNSTAVSNPEITTLAVGNYAYLTNTSGNENYTANITGMEFILSVLSEDINISYGPPGTTGFLYRTCGPAINNASAFPVNQTATYGIDKICNNGTISTAVTVKYTGTLRTNWTLYASNVSITANLTALTSSAKTLWNSLAVNACMYVWHVANCSYVTGNPNVTIDYGTD